MTMDEYMARFPAMYDDESLVCDAAAEMHDEPEDGLQAEPEIVSEYDEHESDFDSEPGPDPVTAVLEPESELQLDSYQEEEEKDVTLDVLSDDDESLDEKVDEEDAVEES